MGPTGSRNLIAGLLLYFLGVSAVTQHGAVAWFCWLMACVVLLMLVAAPVINERR